MRHCTLQDMFDALLENPEEIVVSSNSKHCVLYGSRGQDMLFLTGDFSGSKREVEAEVRRILNEEPRKVSVIT
jgi:hypothetical protein